MFLKLGGANGESGAKNTPKRLTCQASRNRSEHARQAASAVPVLEEHSRAFRRSSARLNEGHCCHLVLAEGDRFSVKPVLVFALKAAIGVAVCAGTILAMFAWTGASL